MPAPHDEPSLIVRQREDPLVVTVDEPLTSRCVQQLRSIISGVPRQRPVIIDMTTINGFDSAGTSDLQVLQDELGPEHLVVVGLRQAAARLFGLATMFADSQDPIRETTPRVRPTPGMVLVETKPDWSSRMLQSALHAAVAKDIAIVVVDLGSVATMSIDVLDAITSASRAAATLGEELVLLNVSRDAAALLGRVPLAATTYLVAGTAQR